VADDDDWFESALQDDENADEEDDPLETADAEGPSDDDADDADADAFEDAFDDVTEGDDDPFDDVTGGDDDPFDDAGFENLDAGDAPDDAPSDDDSSADNPFAGDDAPGTAGDTPADTDDNPFAGDDGPGGGGGGGEDHDLFDQDFGSAFEGSGDQGFGFGGDDGGQPGGPPGLDDDFDDEEFESDIPRIDLGIGGLDSMVQGGVPERSLMVVMGSAGTGKTTFGLQFLNEALEDGESAVFITLEETRSRILSTADEKGWDFPEYVEEGRLAVIDIDPIEMANSLTSIRSELPQLVEEFGANRLVLDSVSLLEMMYDDQATRRSEVYDFTKSLKQAGVTTMLTSEASEDNPFVSRYGIIEYLVDAVFVLRYVRPEDFRETRLAVEIQKIRDANHSRETKPYEITNEGISVYRQANIF
jgi:KaiC domain protein